MEFPEGLKYSKEHEWVLVEGSMATIGRSHAVAESMGMKFDGFVAWLMWLFIHLIFLVGFRNRVAVLMQWTYAYLRYRRGARIITGLAKHEPGTSTG